MYDVTVVGAGLAGCEASYQLAKRGYKVRLIEMRPKKSSDAHSTSLFGELVCSNSLRSNALTNAVGLLKEEMRTLDSLIMKVADHCAIPAGSALAVDRNQFAQKITDEIRNNPNIEVICEEVTEIPNGPTIIASGPLTSDGLSKAIKEYYNLDSFYFYDAAAPIVTYDSIDFNKAYFKSRYDKGEADYINCPMNKEEFEAFYEALISANVHAPKDFEKEIYFEGCMPFEVMAKRGKQTLLYGPMKPVGLEHNGIRPYAVVQLRQDNAVKSLYNIVGFQTHLTYAEQNRIVRMIPGLENAEIVRYGVMHRNTYINAPLCLRETYQDKKRDDLFFAGQLTGVEGYVESAGSGLLAGINMAKYLAQEEPVVLGNGCMLGAMVHYITHASSQYFQPMNANFGIFNLETKVKKSERKEAYAPQALAIIKDKLC